MWLLPDTTSGGQKCFPPIDDIYTSPNLYLHYLSTNCAFLGSQPWLPSLLFYLTYTFTIIALIRYNRLCIRQLANQLWCCRTIIDLFTSNLKLNRQTTTINHQMNLRSVACTDFSDGLRFLTYRSRTMLMCFNVVAINKFPLPIRINGQRLENPAPLVTQ